ncbi:hypothetical protein [Streptomyces sp. NPDC059816]|uniref:hypothetical protein n=1 Tax=Streptomyces sp. NPDC059816 TaxID=3346960 RepID=UPI00365E9A08
MGPHRHHRPYLQANWTEGLHLADAPTDHERSIQADALWRELGTRQILSAQAMADKLYGTAPRCLTYLDTALRQPGNPPGHDRKAP